MAKLSFCVTLCSVFFFSFANAKYSEEDEEEDERRTEKKNYKKE